MCEQGCENVNCSIFVLLSVPKSFLPLTKKVPYFNKAGDPEMYSCVSVNFVYTYTFSFALRLRF